MGMSPRCYSANTWLKSIDMKKGLNLRWSLIQCSGGDEGDRTPDLLTASQALSQLSYAPVRRSTIRELGRRCKDNFGKYFAARGTGAGPKRHTMPDIARGASPVGGGKPAAFLCWARHVTPGAAGQTKAIRGTSGARALPHVFGPIYGTERSSPQLVAL